MPRITIERTAIRHRRHRPEGLIADVPNKDGTYETSVGPITIEMNPPEANGIWAIALTCDVFEDHQRSVGGHGAKRRVVHLSQDGDGAVPLSFFERLKVDGCKQ